MFWVFLAVVVLGLVFVKLGMLWVQNSLWEGAFKGLFMIIAGVLGFFGWRRFRDKRVAAIPVPARQRSPE